MFLIEEELNKLPAKPGVYIMHGEKDEIIYVGKAKILKNRVRQYFQSSRNKGPKIEQMVTHITRFEYIVTDSEQEAEEDKESDGDRSDPDAESETEEIEKTEESSETEQE